MEALLKPGESIVIPATDSFAVSANFAPDMTAEARVLIESVLGNFVRWFFEKTEDAGASSIIEWWELQSNASNTRILTELGGPAEAETTIASVYWLMLQQNAGQPGPLATNGWGNVFYVRDTTGQLRSVNIHWCASGWSVDAMQTESAAEWPIRDRVFRTQTTR